MQEWIVLQLLFSGLVRDILFQTGQNLSFNHLDHPRINSLVDNKKRLPIHSVDPIVTGGTQTEFLACDIMAWKLGLIAVVDTHMSIDIERACLLGSHLHPPPAQRGAPLLRAVIRREQTNLIAECAHLRHPIEPQQFAPLSRGAITQ